MTGIMPRTTVVNRVRALRQYGWAMPWQFWAFQAASMLRRGVLLDVIPSWRCNLSCEYCSLKNAGGVMPDDPPGTPLPVSDWVKFIESFPVRVAGIKISGGEPTLRTGTLELANWALRRGYLVTIYSNLTNTRLLNVVASWRLRIIATWHEDTDQEAWLKRFRAVREKHRGLVAKELGAVKRLSMASWLNKWCDVDGLKQVRRGHFRAGPDQHVFIDCYHASEGYKA